MDFIAYVERLGLPIALLVVVGLAGWRVSRWIATDVAAPLVSRHTRFLDSLEETTSKMSDSVDTMAKTTEEHLRLQHEETAQLSALRAATEEQTALLRVHLKQSDDRIRKLEQT